MTKYFVGAGYAMLISLAGSTSYKNVPAEPSLYGGMTQSCLSTHVFNDCGSSGYITFGFNAVSGAGSGVADPLTIQRSNMAVGINTTSPQARLHIKGSGADNTTSSLLVNNNANAEVFRILDNGYVGIGTASPQSTLAVNGNITTLRITATPNGWPDYVFAPDYPLPSLPQVEEYINRNKHLPDVVSAKEVKNNGVDLGKNQAMLLKKVEELTLYLIEQHKQLEKLEAQNQQLQARSQKLETQLHSLTPAN
jgi:hypothetical protein